MSASTSRGSNPWEHWPCAQKCLALTLQLPISHTFPFFFLLCLCFLPVLTCTEPTFCLEGKVRILRDGFKHKKMGLSCRIATEIPAVVCQLQVAAESSLFATISWEECCCSSVIIEASFLLKQGVHRARLPVSRYNTDNEK